LERVKFVAIVSSNLDEFFQVRVAGLLEQADSGITKTSPDGMSPREQLEGIRSQVIDLNNRIDALVNDEIQPALEDAGIRVVGYDDLSNLDRQRLNGTFEENIFPVLTPLAVDPTHPFPFISDLSLNLAVLLRAGDDGDLQFARVKIPPNVSRFIAIDDDESRFVPLEQVVGHHLGRLFGGLDVVDYYAFRVTRSADLDVEEEEADDLLAAMESVLRYRHRAAHAVRLEVEAGIDQNVLKLLLHGLQLTPNEVYHRHAPLGLAGLWAAYALDRPDLKDKPWTPKTQPVLSDQPGHRPNFFEQTKRGDVLVHFPYESFTTSIGAFLAQAAADPDVLAIKQTLYRTSIPDDPAIGGEAAVVRSLIEAAEAGKQVVVLIELKARFDEAANIAWAKMLENAGVHVVYGVSGLKTHAKILLVVRREAGGLRRYSNIGTGNYNPNTARIYEDMSLFTADYDIGADLSELFNRLTGYAKPTSYRKLLVAPDLLRSCIVDRIRQQADRGPEGRILLKLNHIVDPGIIEELYEASDAGCKVDLIIRGMCAIRAGVPGMSDNITVRSLVGKYLEHSRIYRFGQPGSNAIYYMGSADMMERNLNGRVEAITPVTDPVIQARLEKVLQVEMSDDTLAFEQLPDGNWEKMPTDLGIDSHEVLEEQAIERARSGDASTQ